VSHREQLCKWKLELVLQVLAQAQALLQQEQMAQALLQQEQMAQALGLLDHEECRFPLQIDQPEQTLVHRQPER
jgi:hypothetical protein